MIENGQGFMGFWSDIDPPYQLRYQEWHNCEHMPERVAVPGFLEGRRYRNLGEGTTFFMCYVTQSPDVLASPAYLAALNRPTPWTQEALTKFQNPTRTLYARLGSVGSGPAHRPYVALLRFDDPRPQAELIAQLTGTASLFEVNVAASGIMTEERKIYSGGPGRQQYLIALEGGTEAEVRARLDALTAALAGSAGDLDAGVFWLENRIRAQDLQIPPAV